MTARHPTALRFGRILLTGGAGNLGRELRTRLLAYCDVLRVSDIAALGPAAPGEEVRVVALEDKAAVDDLQKERFLLADDAARLVREAEASDVLRAGGKE